MKRDLDLCREILRQIEEMPDTNGEPIDIEVEGGRRHEISYHVKILNQGGIIDAIDCSTVDGLDWRPTALTWAGQEFLALARSETVWRKAKRQVLTKTGTITFELLKRALVSLSLKHLD